MHDKECYGFYYTVKKYAAKDDDKRHDRGDQGDGAKHHGGGGRGESTRCWTLKGINLPRTVAPKNLMLGKKVLHRQTKRVKLDRITLVSSKTTNIDKIFNDAWCN